MVIGGLQKFSLIDYPGRVCAVVFTRGCNFRCSYCHNPELVIADQYSQEISLSHVLDFLKKRRRILDAVCITGGEPTLHEDLIEIIAELKGMGYSVKLDSNGSRPDILELLIEKNLVDYLAVDIKAPLGKYLEVTGIRVSTDKIRRSIDLLINSGIQHEFRTTVVKNLITVSDLQEIAQTIKDADSYFLQRFNTGKLLDPSFANEGTYSEEELQRIAEDLKTYVKDCRVR